MHDFDTFTLHIYATEKIENVVRDDRLASAGTRRGGQHERIESVGNPMFSYFTGAPRHGCQTLATTRPDFGNIYKDGRALLKPGDRRSPIRRHPALPAKHYLHAKFSSRHAEQKVNLTKFRTNRVAGTQPVRLNVRKGRGTETEGQMVRTYLKP